MAKFCGKCGAPVGANDKFCGQCRAPLVQNYTQPVSRPAPVPTPQPKPQHNQRPKTPAPQPAPRKKAVLGIVAIIAALVLVAGGIWAYLTFSNTVKLDPYISVTFSGANGDGHAYAEFDYAGFYTDYSDKIQYKSGSDLLDAGMSLFANPAAALAMTCVNGSLDNQYSLSNGDEVTYIWNCDDATAKSMFGVRLKYSDITVTVEGLDESSDTPSESTENGATQGQSESPVSTENTTVDNASMSLQILNPFEGIEIQYDGVSPYLTVSVNDSRASSAVQDYISFQIKGEQAYVGCGDVYTLEAIYNVDALADAGWQVSSYEQQYTVPTDLPKFLTAADELDLQRLKNEIDDYVEAQLSGAVGGSVYSYDGIGALEKGGDHEGVPWAIHSVDSIQPVRAYWMNRKTQYDSDSVAHNRYSVLYKITTSGAELGWMAEEKDVGTRDIYVIISAENIYDLGQGNSFSWTGDAGLGGEKLFGQCQLGVNDQLIANYITALKDEYNVTELEP